MAVSPGMNLLSLAQALHQDCKDAKTDIARFSLNVDCFPPESHFDFGLKSQLTLLERACNNKVSTVSHAALEYCIRTRLAFWTPSASKPEWDCLQGETAQPTLGNFSARLYSLSHCV